MKRTQTFVLSIGTVPCRLVTGRVLEIPVIPGIFKHPSPAMLRKLLENPDIVLKYTYEALRRAGWPILRQFPRDWLRACLAGADLPPARRLALGFLLS